MHAHNLLVRGRQLHLWRKLRRLYTKKIMRYLWRLNLPNARVARRVDGDGMSPDGVTSAFIKHSVTRINEPSFRTFFSVFITPPRLLSV